MAEALGLTASIIAVLQLTATTLGACYKYCSGVKNASKDKKLITDQLRGLQIVLEDVCELVKDDTFRLPATIQLLDSPNGLSCCSAELEFLKEKLELKGGRLDRVQVLIWPFKEGDVKKTLDHLGRFQQSLSLAMNTDQTRSILAIREDTDMMKGLIQHIKQSEHRQKILTWLAAPDHETSHAAACTKREEATGSWLVKGDCFSKWKSNPNSFLWVHGIPGAGKTILCSTIVDDVSRYCKSDPLLGIAFFYFDFQDKDALPHAVLRSLIKQLFLQCKVTPDALVKLYSECSDGQRSPTLEGLISTAKSIIQNFLNVYIILDALDECPERNKLLKLLEVIHDWSIGTLHILVTSRKKRDIEVRLRRLVSYEVAMDEGDVDGDVRIHVSRVLDQDIEFQMFSAEEKQKIEATLVNGTHGMFRWVACQLDALQNCRSPAALKKALKSLPRTLNGTYDRILRHIDDDDRQDALKLLQWLAFSARTISLTEAIEVLATDADVDDEPLFDPHRRLRDPRDVLRICSSLVTITASPSNLHMGDDECNDHNDERTGHDLARFSQNAQLKLAHFSVREYLISDYLRMGDSRVSFYHFNKKIADTFIAKACLAYLLQLGSHGCVNSSTIEMYPLADYAAQNWIDHAKSDSEGKSDTLHGLTMKLLVYGRTLYRNWLFIHNPDDVDEYAASTRYGLSVIGTPLYYTSLVGLQRATQALLDEGAKVNMAWGECYGNALQAASFNGHGMIVQLLLEMGADANAEGGQYGNALQAASFNGHDIIVRLLLKKGADANAQGGKYGTALQAASCNGRTLIVQLLLKMDADVNAQGGEYGNALQAASFNGHDMIVRLLLEKGADVNAQGGDFANALQAASFKGHDMIVRLLLEKGADVNAHGGDFANALQAASFKGHDMIVRLLLEKGVDVNAQGGRHGNALQAASLCGYDGIVRLLLENGADVNARGQRITALQAASFNGHDKIVKLLLEEGANVNAKGGPVGDALQAASLEGHKSIVQLLLDMGANINAQDQKPETQGTPKPDYWMSSCETLLRLMISLGEDVKEQDGQYGTPLQAASSRGDDAIVRLLLERGADVNVKGGEHGNALQAASSRGYTAIAQLLLENGAEINAQGGVHWTGLQAACHNGHEATVKLLLEKGVDVNVQGGYYGNALQSACSNGHKEIVRLLLEAGADVNACGGYYGSALQAASSEGDDMVFMFPKLLDSPGPGPRNTIVRLLLEYGADVNAEGGPYGDALQAALSAGHDVIMRLLLEQGAHLNAHGNGEVALQAASSQGYEMVVQLLLDKGMDVNAQGSERYESALHEAASNGHDVVVRLLLKYGADVNVRGENHGTALQAAASRGYVTIVRLLLKEGADVNAQGGCDGSALQVASSNGHVAMVQLLLEKGADVNAPGGHDGNALQRASSRGFENIVQLLLEHGADVNAQGGHNGNALRAALWGRHTGIVWLLLKNGADINSQDGRYGTALHAASSEGGEELVHVLLKPGADANGRGGYYGSSLQASSSRGHETIVRCFLEPEAEINAQGGGYGNVLQAASS